MELIFATNNKHKVAEMQLAIGNHFRLITLAEAGIRQEIPEPHDTLEANASEKSFTIHRLTGKNCFSEDTGLEVPALHGAPGVHSARYAGPEADPVLNMEKLLDALQGNPDRKAQFRTVISLIWNGTEYLFTGICPGRIAPHRAGSNGFGYDPVFIPEGSQNTFAEMDAAEKNTYSHRRKAAEALIAFLKKQPPGDEANF